MSNTSKLVRMRLKNIGCVGNDGITIALDNIVCLVGKNNAGKSTILRAYELAYGSGEPFSPIKDRYQHADSKSFSEVELEVHIPEGVANIDEKWKVHESELSIVRSLWRWDGTNSKSTRFTWDPQLENWAMDGKAGGADNVFKSRLPKPIRIGSLEDADTTEKNLLTFALAPLITAVERERQDGSSNLANALSQVIDELSALSGVHAEHFNLIASKVSTGFKGIFPGLDVLLDIKPASLTSELTGLVKKDAGLKVKDGNYETSVSQQGTGARRALFWSML